MAISLSDLKPMSPTKGPPLPIFLNIYWPWHKKALPKSILSVITTTGKAMEAPAVPATIPAVTVVAATEEDIAKLTPESQEVLQKVVAAGLAQGQTPEVVSAGNVVAILTPTGSVILPNEATTAEELAEATAAVQAKLVEQGVITVEPETGIATPVVSTVVQPPTTIELIEKGVSPTSQEFINAAIIQQWPREWASQMDLNVPPKPAYVTGGFGFPNLKMGGEANAAFVSMVGWPAAYWLAHNYKEVSDPEVVFEQEANGDGAVTTISIISFAEADRILKTPLPTGFLYENGYLYWRGGGLASVFRAKAVPK